MLKDVEGFLYSKTGLWACSIDRHEYHPASSIIQLPACWNGWVFQNLEHKNQSKGFSMISPQQKIHHPNAKSQTSERDLTHQRSNFEIAWLSVPSPKKKLLGNEKTYPTKRKVGKIIKSKVKSDFWWDIYMDKYGYKYINIYIYMDIWVPRRVSSIPLFVSRETPRFANSSCAMPKSLWSSSMPDRFEGWFSTPKIMASQPTNPPEINGILPSRKLTYPTWGKWKSSSTCIFQGYMWFPGGLAYLIKGNQWFISPDHKGRLFFWGGIH